MASALMTESASIRETQMNKKELVGALADHCGTTQAQAGEFVSAFCEIVTNEMKKGDKASVALPGFGQFVAKHRASREMRNPSTGQMMMSKAKTSATFKPSAALKTLLR